MVVHEGCAGEWNKWAEASRRGRAACEGWHGTPFELARIEHTQAGHSMKKESTHPFTRRNGSGVLCGRPAGAASASGRPSLADRKAKALALHEGLRTVPHRALVLGPVLTPGVAPPGRRWCTPCPVSRGTAPPLRPVRETKAGRPECPVCVTGPDLADWRRVGTALGRAALPVKKRPDAVD